MTLCVVLVSLAGCALCAGCAATKEVMPYAERPQSVGSGSAQAVPGGAHPLNAQAAMLYWTAPRYLATRGTCWPDTVPARSPQVQHVLRLASRGRP